MAGEGLCPRPGRGFRRRSRSSTTLRGAEISRRAGLERLVGKDKAREILETYDNLAPELVRFVKIDGFGRDRGSGYNLNTASSSVYSFMTRIARLPGLAIEAGESFLSREESELDVTYQGESSESRGAAYRFTARHPSGQALLVINKELGIPDRLEYTASYTAENQLRREGYSLVLREKRNLRWPDILPDPLVNKALVLGSLVRPELDCGRKIIQGFLDSADPERQNLGAAYCGLRGIPEGLDIAPYLKSANPIVRFNAAKAILKFRAESGPLRALTLDPDPYVRRRAVNFFEHEHLHDPRLASSPFISPSGSGFTKTARCRRPRTTGRTISARPFNSSSRPIPGFRAFPKTSWSPRRISSILIICICPRTTIPPKSIRSSSIWEWATAGATTP